MENYHITTKIAFAIDAVLILVLMAQRNGAGSVIFPPILGSVALSFCTCGQIRQKTKLGIVLITVNVIFSLWLSILAEKSSSGSILQPFRITIPVILLFLVVQLVLCFKANSIKIKLVPAAIVVILSIFVGLLGTLAFFIEDFDSMMILVLTGAYAAMPGLIGGVLGWAVYGLYSFGQRRG